MSIRAHIVEKIDYKGEVFNLWHDKKLLALLEIEGCLDSLNTDLCGLMEVPRSLFETYIKINVPDEEKYTQNNIKKLLKDNPDTEYFMFYCF